MSFSGILGIDIPRGLQRTWDYIFGFTTYWWKINAVEYQFEEESEKLDQMQCPLKDQCEILQGKWFFLFFFRNRSTGCCYNSDGS